MSDLLYADADSTPEDARFAIVGAPFELTTCHRKGCREGPGAIRAESYNFETHIPGADVDIEDFPICDMGDIVGADFPAFARAAAGRASEVLSSGAFPILIGGEHSVTPLWLAALTGADPWSLLDGGGGMEEAADGQTGRPMPADELCVVMVDAHMDFRDGYEGQLLSHAAASRRVSDVVGGRSVIPFGVRSFSSGELKDATERDLVYVLADEVREMGPVEAVVGALKRVPAWRNGKVYLSVDIDGIDPAFAPGVGTPEPFGLDPIDVRELIRYLAPHLVGFDVVEVCPPADNGNTAALAARLIGEVMGWVGRTGR